MYLCIIYGASSVSAGVKYTECDDSVHRPPTVPGNNPPVVTGE